MSMPSMEEAARARRQRLLNQSSEAPTLAKVQSSTNTPTFKRPLPKTTNTPSKSADENPLGQATSTIEEQANQLLEELSKSGILGVGVENKKLSIDELTPKDANMDLKRMLEEKSITLEEETREAIDELVRKSLAEALKEGQ